MKVSRQFSEKKERMGKLYEQFKNHPDKRALFSTFSEEELIFLVKNFPFQLEFIDNQTERVIMWALKKNSSALQFVKNQTEKHCLIALDKRLNGDQALDYVKILTDDIKRMAVTRSRSAVSSFPMTEEFYLIAIENHNLSVQFIQDQTKAIKKLALERNPRELDHISHQTIEDCLQSLSSLKTEDEFNGQKPIYKMVKIVSNPDFETTVQNLKMKQSMISMIEDLK